ncbi:CBS domain-containing protein [Neobacillus fumarioli]|uniref:CBS domain-containing protein n=1 Tax=Neobacillus fumarioli TaxID=105229 RepID=UPI000AC76B8A|nr:CBS domain-containing protein [Neobacillus fumarioli]
MLKLMKEVKIMYVKDFMITDVISGKRTDSVKDVIKLFVAKKIGGVPIVDEEGKLYGIVTDGDLLRALKPSDRRFQDYFSFAIYLGEMELKNQLSEVVNRPIMKIARTAGIVTVHPDDDMKKVVTLLAKHRFKKLPVVDDTNYVVGVISRGDAIRNIQQMILNELE